MTNEPLSPAEARRWYLDHRRDDARQDTQDSITYGLDIFVDWTDHADIETMDELGGRELLAFKNWRKQTADIKRISLNGTMSVLRRFVKFCEQIDAVDEDLHEKVPVPNVSEDDEVADDVPPDDAVEVTRTYLGQYEYGSRQHLEFELGAELGIRMGAMRAIDLEDLDFETPVIRLRHRPEAPGVKGTPLKNGRDGQRHVNLPRDLHQTLLDYIEGPRIDVTDRFDRAPLLTTDYGRVARTTIRRDFYKATRPCVYAGECPHDREIDSCPATKSAHASQCPSSFSPHPARTWSIMAQLDAGMPKDDLSDRVDVSVPVLNKHYDRRSEARKSRKRREELADRLPGYSLDNEDDSDL